MGTLAEQRIAELDTEFGIEEVDVLDDTGTMLLHVLWDSSATGTGHDETLLVRVERDADWNLSLAGCRGRDIELMQAPLDLPRWVTRDRKVWERCRNEWARYLEWREP